MAKLVSCLIPSSIVAKILPFPYVENVYKELMDCVEEEGHAYEEVKIKD